MAKITLVALFGAVAATAAMAPVRINRNVPAEDVVPNSWIVKFFSNATLEQRTAHMGEIKAKLGATGSVDYEYDFQAFQGYAATMPREMVDLISTKDDVVEYVEADLVVRTSTPVPKFNNSKPAACEMQLEATWGIVRTQERNLNINGEYVYNSANLGAGVDAYVIDTGIYLEHAEFEGRAKWGFNAFTSGVDAGMTDGNGHGTHCAGTVGSKTYGIAKEAELIAVKVLGATGSGSTAGVIAGVDFVCTDHKAKGNKCVSNLSLGGGYSAAMNAAVDNLADCGCSVAVASGNEGRDACLSSPASADGVMTVNAMDSTDTNSYFSNYGSCSNIYAPGSGITSTWIGSRFAINTISGTSMAAPHVCGVMAKVAQVETTVPQSVYQEITRDATPGKVLQVPGGASTPNLLLYSECQI